MLSYKTYFDSELNISYDKSIVKENQSRNKIIFSISDIEKVPEILNSYINNFIGYFKKFGNYENFVIFNKKAILEVQANELNTGIIIRDVILDHNLVEYILNYDNLTYLNINDIIYVNKLFKENIKNILIKRNILTFHQNNDTVRKYLYDFIKDNVNKIDELFLFGGEMYIFQNIIKYNYLYAYSDYSSIVKDTIINNKDDSMNNHNIKLIDYSNFKFNNNSKDSLTICNTSKNGLNKNIASQINTNNLIIISCNKKSFNKDFNILKNNYNILKCVEVNNIFFYLLSKNK